MFTRRESIFDLEFNSSWAKYFFFVFVFSLGFFFVFYNIHKDANYDYRGEFYKNHIKDEFQGVVHRKWFYHHEVYIKLVDSTEIIGYYSIYKRVNKGDSIIKKKNSKEIILNKTDSIIYNDIYDQKKFHFKLK